jgi:hypothetical protein
MKRNTAILFLFALLLSCFAFSQKKTSVYATTDKEKILIGEQLELTLGAHFPTPSSVSFFRLDSLPHFEIIRKSKIDTQQSASDIHLSQHILLTSWDSGKWQMPSFSLAGSKTKTKPLSINVVFSDFDPKEDYHDIKDILEVQKPDRIKWYWYVIGAALLLALFALLFPKKKKGAAEVHKEDVHAYKTALAELQKLKKEQLANKDVKAYYVALIDVFRKYLQQKKGIQSYNKTTDDLALQVQNLKMHSVLFNNLVQTLRLSDAVKFAKFQPAEEENNSALETISKSIDAIENS